MCRWRWAINRCSHGLPEVWCVSFGQEQNKPMMELLKMTKQSWSTDMVQQCFREGFMQQQPYYFEQKRELKPWQIEGKKNSSPRHTQQARKGHYRRWWWLKEGGFAAAWFAGMVVWFLMKMRVIMMLQPMENEPEIEVNRWRWWAEIAWTSTIPTQLQH